LHLTDVSDEELLARIWGGDTTALEFLLSKYLQGIFSVSFRICGDADDANDITQNVCLKIMKHVKTFRKESEVKTWIYRIAYTESLQFIKWRREFVELDEIEPYLGEPDTYLIDEKDARVLIQKSIHTLSYIDRSIILFYYYDDLKIREIADILDVNENTVKTRLSRAKLRLQPLLEPLWKHL
jgi:RNA polymerase sigma-70 factor, ECF subfamily